MEAQLVVIDSLEGVRTAQGRWAALPIGQRVALIGRLRRRLAVGAAELAATIPTELPGALHRTAADSLMAEVLPLIEACRFLEREAVQILRTKNLGSEGLPLWLNGVASEVHRAPRGVVLVIAAANYPLLLAGVQTVQALAAGNAVLWKPAPGTEAVVVALRSMLLDCGLNAELLTVLDAQVDSVTAAIAAGVDYTVLTGSAETGRAVLRQLAETLTPAAMELSGCDAVFVLPGADLEHTVRALAFGLRFNGSFTCMAPQRVFLAGLAEGEAARFEDALAAALHRLAGVSVPKKTGALLRELIDDARLQGARVLLDGLAESGVEGEAAATLLTRATPALKAMQADVFAPILSVMRTADLEEALTANAACPYALSAAIFGEEKGARALARRLRVGNVLINDIIISTADPRIAFGGRGRSGFGVTRGAEGLLTMTTLRTVQVQRRRGKRVYETTSEGQMELFAGLAKVLHGRGIRDRWAGLKSVVRGVRK